MENEIVVEVMAREKMKSTRNLEVSPMHVFSSSSHFSYELETSSFMFEVLIDG